MITILQAIQQANTDAGIPNLSFAQLQEFNSFLDSFTFNDWPRNIVAPFTVTGDFRSLRSQEVVILEGWVLRRIPEDTNDYRSVEIEPLYIDPMRVFARKFIRRMLDTEIVDPQRETSPYTITPEYRFLPAHLFGVGYRVQIPTFKNVC